VQLDVRELAIESEKQDTGVVHIQTSEPVQFKELYGHVKRLGAIVRCNYCPVSAEGTLTFANLLEGKIVADSINGHTGGQVWMQALYQMGKS